MGFNGCNLWPISAVASTTNGRLQRSQPPFRSAFLGQFSLPTCAYEKNRAVRVVGCVFPWRTSLARMDGSETHGFCMHGRDLASDRQGYFVKRPRKNTRRQAGRFQRRGLLRTLNKQFWVCTFMFCSVTSLPYLPLQLTALTVELKNIATILPDKTPLKCTGW